MINPHRRQLIARKRDDLGLRDHSYHAFQGCRLNGLGHMGGLEHTRKSLAVFRGCMDEVSNGNVSPNLLKLGGDVSLGLAFFGGRRSGFGSRLCCGGYRGLA